MAWDVKQLSKRAVALARRPRIRKIAIWFASVMLAIGVLGALVAPPLIRAKLASELSQKLHREVSIERIRINPFAMTATIRGFLMRERQKKTIAVSFDELYLNVELRSLIRWGVVVKELRLLKPYVNVVRNDDFKYNFQDLIDEFMSGPAGPTPRFALNNIEVIDGKIDFDDRPEQTQHLISSIRISVPFISSLPSYVDIKVQPAFSANVNGAPLVIGGETKPFKDSLESQLQFEINDLNIPKYVEYSPVELGFKVSSGQINGKLTASFRSSRDKPSVLAISGNVALNELVLQEQNQTPLINVPSLEVIIDALEVFANKATLKVVKAQGMELHVRRARDGKLNLQNLVKTPAPPAPPEPKKGGSPFIFNLDDLMLESGRLHLTDETGERPYRTRLENIHFVVKGLTNEPDKKADLELSFQSPDKEHISATSALQLSPLLAEGDVEIKGLRLDGLRPYYESFVGVEIKEGQLDLSSHFALQQKDEKLDAKLTGLNAALRSLRLDVPGESEPLWRSPLLAIKDASLDFGKKSVLIGSFESRDGNGFIHRDADGTMSYARLIKTRSAGNETVKSEKENDADWSVETKRVALNGFKIAFEDRSLGTPTRMVVSELSGQGENFSNALNSRARISIRAKINERGILTLGGTLGTRPLVGRLDVEARGIEIMPFQPYLADQINFLLTGGEIGTQGLLTFASGAAGPPKVNFEGNLQVTDFGSIEKNGSQDLIKWKSLNLDGVLFALEPMQLRINGINLSDFYSRVIIGSDGKINLQYLTAQKTEKKEDAIKTPSADNSSQASSTAPSSEKQMTIGKINLQGGNIDFSDFFVKPNYSANLTSVEGKISELKREAPGDIELTAKLDHAAPVDIRGKINPLSKELFLDIIADAREIELSPLSPYSGKYVGYGIEKGKLSFNVKYKLENRKLSADSKIILNQLTFGDRIDSPDAIQLPVLLAVALLKDRNGVIDVDLPISGSLDDPQFSVGGIVLRIIINIITKAITAPFALLGALFGGGAEELSTLEFEYGRANLTPAAESRIKTLATAMHNRPALKLEISGRVDPINDLDGLKKTSIERKLKAQKMKDLVRQGKAPKSTDEVQVEKAEYERFLKAAYGDETFPKPRNLIGLARDLPVPEMESLMLKHAQVSDDDLRELGNRRAQAVRDRLLATGQVTADRLFIVASKPVAPEDQERAKLSRVDFSVK